MEASNFLKSHSGESNTITNKQALTMRLRNVAEEICSIDISKRYLNRETFSISKNYLKSKEHYKKAIFFMKPQNLTPSWVNVNETGFLRSKAANNEKDINIDLLYSYWRQNKTDLYAGWLQRYIAEILLLIDEKHMPDAEAWIKKAIASDSNNGMMWHLGRDYAFYAELLKKLNVSRFKYRLNMSMLHISSAIFLNRMAKGCLFMELSCWIHCYE